MFPLHESTQRWVCRAAFALLCLIPTTSLVAYAVWLKTPLHRTSQANAWSQRTGAAVSINHLLYPQPGMTRLENVTLEHPHTGATLAQVRELEVGRDSEGVYLLAAQPQLNTAEMDELWRQLQRQLLSESFPACRHLRLIANDATLISNRGDAQTLAKFQMSFQADGQQRTLTAKYLLAESKSASPAIITIAHDGQELSKLHWQTGGVELPLAAWTTQLPWLARLGNDCRFRGEIAVEQTPAGISGVISGMLVNVDLDRLISDALPHKLSGEATITIRSARFAGGRLTHFDGGIHGGPGVIGDALITNAVEQWRLQQRAETAADSPSLARYESLALDLRMQHGRLNIRGACAGETENTLLKLEDGRRWMTAGADHNPASLIRILSREVDANIPATDATRELIRWLPLSAEVGERENSGRPQAHLRGGL